MQKKGFTLIELLVVISIVALLSSIVMASLNSAREKGRLGAAKYFAAQVDHIAGEQAVGIWDFDECSGTTVGDRSGFSNAGTFSGTPTWSTNTPSGKGCALDFSGSANYVQVPDSTSLKLSNNFTISLWIYLKVISSSIFMLKGDNLLHGAAPSYGFNSNGFMFIANNANNAPYDARYGSDINRWHHLVGVIDTTTRYIYMDGKIVSTVGSGNDSWNNVNNLIIGASGTGYSANAILDEVRVYAKTLTASEIGELYAEGLRRHDFASN